MAKAQETATIIDVAARAGVSIGTVSRVSNNVGNARPETLQRVREAMTALNYVPNHVARSLKRQTTEQIELVIPDIANPVYVSMAKAVQQTAKERGYRLSLISTDDNPVEEALAVKSLKQQHVDGLIICSLRITPRFVSEVQSAARKICVIGQMPAESSVDNVRVDSASGAALAVNHLAEQGHQRIAFINGTANTVPAEARQKGYTRGLIENHLTYDPSLVIHTDFTMSGGYTAVDALLDKHLKVDALFCASDIMALGALRRLQELKIRVPKDVAVIGMDDIELGKVSSPTLTSISLLAGERGRVAAQLLLERLADPELEARKVTVMPRLVARESSTGYVVHTAGRGAGHAPR